MWRPGGGAGCGDCSMTSREGVEGDAEAISWAEMCDERLEDLSMCAEGRA